MFALLNRHTHSHSFIYAVTYTLSKALKFMGKVLTLQQKELVNTKLDVDLNGKVVFSEFVQLAQEMFAFKMESSHLEAGLVLALTQKEGLELPPYPRKVNNSVPSSFLCAVVQRWIRYSGTSLYEDTSL